MTEIAKVKINTWGNNAYKSFLTLGMATLLFNLGVYKKDLDSRTHDEPEEFYRHLEQTRDNTDYILTHGNSLSKKEMDDRYVKAVDYNKAMEDLISSMTRIEYKIDNR